MKKIKTFLVITLFLASFSGYCQKDDVLTNETVINMVNKKLPTSIITGKIRSSKNSFKVGTDDLIALTDQNVPEAIINAMVEAANDEKLFVIKTDPNNPFDQHKAGIYYCNKKDGHLELIEMDPSMYSQSKSGGGLASAMTYGLAKVKVSVTLDGKEGRFQLNDQKPEFYFYFDDPNSEMNQNSDWWFATAKSPNEFLLVKLTKNSKTREVVTGSANALGSSIGVDDKNKAEFSFEKISTGIYRVYFEKPLSGEFCFMYTGMAPAGFTSMNKVYDFGINNK